jgi:hypothetical protein
MPAAARACNLQAVQRHAPAELLGDVEGEGALGIWTSLSPGNVSAMTAQPDDDLGSYEVIHLGGESAAIVPLPELRRLQAAHRHVSAELIEDAEVEATLAVHRDWVAAGRPGSVSHEVAMAELLGDQ